MSLRPLLVVLFIGTSILPASAQPDSHTWIPPRRSDELRDLALKVDDARVQNDDALTREAVQKLALAIIEGSPAGGFPVSPERTIGLGSYLEELLSVLPEATRNRATKDIDQLLQARLPESWRDPDNEDRDAIPMAFALRIARDFPGSRFATAARVQLASQLLADGQVESYLDLLGNDVDAGLRASLEELTATTTASDPSGVCFEQPGYIHLGLLWESQRPAPLEWVEPLHHTPVVSGDRIYVQSNDRVNCFSLESGELEWSTPFVGAGRAELSGTRWHPTLTTGLLVAANSERIVGFDRKDGLIEWDLAFGQLLERDADVGVTVIAQTAPVASERGVVIGLLSLKSDSVTAHLVLIDEDGTVRWRRAAGTASGATYAALGSARPSLSCHGDHAYFLTQRGFLTSIHLADGALDWSVYYPGFSARGSSDALRFGNANTDPVLASRDNYLISMPVDANALYVWERDRGRLVASLPRQNTRWWNIHEQDSTVALARERHVTVWNLTPRPEFVREWEIPADLPAITGRGTGQGDNWWFPNGDGYYRLNTESGEWKYQALHTGLAIHDLVPLGKYMFASTGAGAVVVAPHSKEELEANSLAGTFLKARQLAATGKFIEVLPILERLRTHQGTRNDQIRQQLRALSHVVIAHSRSGASDASPDVLAEAVEHAIGILPTADEAARESMDQAIDFARRGHRDAAMRLAYNALESNPGGTRQILYEITPHFHVPVELAAHRLLAQLIEDAAGPPAIHDSIVGIHQEAFDLLKDTTPTSDYKILARKAPFTPAGRQASLELAKRYFREGNALLSRDELRRLVLLEPDTPEAVEARFRLVEQYQDDRRLAAARTLLEELSTRYGKLQFVSNSDLTVGERALAMLEELPEARGLEDPPEDGTLQLQPIWRSRTELLHSRQVFIQALGTHPQFTNDELYLAVADRNVELRNASTGTPLWVSRIPRSNTSKTPWYLDLGRLREPILINRDGILVHDGEVIYFVDVQSGGVRWQRPMPDFKVADEEFTNNHIELIGAGDGVVVALGTDDVLRSFDMENGEPLWAETIDENLPVFEPRPDDVGSEWKHRRVLKVEAGRLLIGYQTPAKVEVRNARTGALVRSLDLYEELAQAPWFIDKDRIALPLATGTIRAVDVNSGKEVWQIHFGEALRSVHYKDELPFPIAQLESGKLVGFSEDQARLLCTRSPRSKGVSIESVRFHAGNLFVLQSQLARRSLVCLEVPPALLEAEVSRDLETPFELLEQWRKRLTTQEISRLHFHQDSILLADTLQCRLTVLTSTGSNDRSTRYRRVHEFIERRRTLHYAGFMGETMLAVTRSGSIGLQPLSRLELLMSTWNSVKTIDLLTAPEERRTPLAAVDPVYRAGRLEEACRILENGLENERMPRAARELVTHVLEGMAQERLEESPLSWSVPRLRRAPVIDGSLEEPWQASHAIEIRAPRFFQPMQGMRENTTAWNGWRDQSAILYTGWSTQGFHLALDVTDDAIYAYDRDDARWRGDCLLLAFDLLGDGGRTARNDDMLLTLALTVPKAQAPPDAGGDEEPEEPPEPEPEEETNPEGEYTVQRKGDDSGVIYEVTIPWATFADRRPIDERASVPSEGMFFRLNLLLTDDDSGQGASSYFSLSPGQKLKEDSRSIWSVFVPAHFPRLKLAR